METIHEFKPINKSSGVEEKQKARLAIVLDAAAALTMEDKRVHAMHDQACTDKNVRRSSQIVCFLHLLLESNVWNQDPKWNVPTLLLFYVELHRSWSIQSCLTLLQSYSR